MGKIKNNSQGRKRNSFKRSVIFFLPILLVLIGGTLAFGDITPSTGLDKQANKILLEKAFKIQMPFIENQGQIPDEHVRFYSKIFGGTVYVTDKGEMIYSLIKKEPNSSPTPGKRDKKSETIAKVWTIKEELIGASIASLQGMDKTQTKVNYFTGNEKDKWKTDLTTYNVVDLGEVYKGIDLQLKAYGKNVEKIFTVKPGADPQSINLKIEGATSLNINDKGELEVETGLGTVSFAKPITFQEINGKRTDVKVAYNIQNSELRTPNSELTNASNLSPQTSNPTYGFKVGNYDKSRPLIVDPLLASTFLGGVNNDYGNAIAIDASGNVFVTGYTNSSDFPRITGFGYSGGEDVFVSKFDPNLSTLLASTYLGGSSNERAWGIAIDGSGSVYVSGWTDSSNYPTTPSPGFPFQAAKAGGQDVFISKLSGNLDGLLASTYLGGNNTDDAHNGIAIDSSGNVYVAGETISFDFPVTTGVVHQGDYDVFVSKFNSGLSSLLASTFIPGNGTDEGSGIALDSSGNVYVTGRTSSTNFPTTVGAYQVTKGGNFDAFVTKLNGVDLSVSASTLIGGSGWEFASSLAIYGGEIFVGGYTTSTDFPTTVGAYDRTYNGGAFDCFLAKMNGDLTQLIASTFIGGSGGGDSSEEIRGIAVNNAGNVYVVGFTGSQFFPTTPGAYQESIWGAGYEAFIARLDNSLTQLLSSTYLGGRSYGNDDASSIAIDTLGNIFVVGSTDSATFPTTSNAPYQTYSGGSDAFVAKLDSDLSAGVDSDGDGLDDNWEISYFGSTGACDPNVDSDGDGLTNLQEYQRGTNPTNRDTDGDGYSDGREVALGTNPNNPSSYPTSYVPDAERAALIDLYNSTNGSGWTNQTNWLSTTVSECDWYGVTCTGNHVTQIYPYQNNLIGTIPPSISNLTNLKFLTLANNQFTGGIPASLGSLTNLIGLALGNTHLTGSIPPELGNLTKLQDLSLSNNQLTGSIPPQLGNLMNLVSLYLSLNQFTGSIPPELGNLTKLQVLDLGSNKLTNDIPVQLGNLTSLQWLILYGNQLTGSIPTELGGLTNLQRLDLSYNQLTGSIPTELGSLMQLQALFLNFNQLTGNIPTSLGNLTKLQILDLYGNQLSGGIPAEFGSLSNLQYLRLHSNQLTGSIPPQLGNLTKLVNLFLNKNRLTGNVPVQIGSLTNLQVLVLSGNQLTGNISQFASLTNLQTLSLSDNQFTGSIPDEIGNLTQLQTLYLRSNKISGALPVSLTNLTQLINNQSYFEYNALYTTDDTLRAFLNQKQAGGNWESTQTIAPTNLTATPLSGISVQLTWTPIVYTADGGGYEVYYSTASGGPYTLYTATGTKSDSGATVTGLTPGTQYFFEIRTKTNPHANNQNIVYSEYTGEVAENQLLTVVKSGNGTVRSQVVGIDCGSTCSQSYDVGTIVTLTAAPDALSYFAGWSDGTDTYQALTFKVMMDAANKTVTATFNPVTSQPPVTTWAKTYGGIDTDDANSIQQTSDGGYIMAGETYSFGAGVFDIWVLKLNPNGTVAWQNTYGGGAAEWAYSIQQTSDGGYIVAGVTGSFGANLENVWVLKLNADGSVAWQNTYGGPNSDWAHSIQQTSDGGYIVAGQTGPYGTGNADLWVLKLNAVGTIEWQKTYGGSGDDVVNSVQQTSDGGYILAGYTSSFGAGNSDVWVLKLNADGSVAWQNTYGGLDEDLANSVQQTSDGGYIVAGRTKSFGAGNEDFWVLKLNSDGSLTGPNAWQKTYGGPNSDWAYSIRQTSDGGYIAGGGTYSFGAGQNAWVLKLNALGTVEWQKTYIGNNEEWAKSIEQTSDGGYIVAGTTYSFGAGNWDAWVLKLDSNGNILGCPGGLIGVTSVTGVDTTATVTTPTPTIANTSATVTNPGVTPVDTTITPGEVCTGIACSYFISPVSELYPSGGGGGSVSVIAPDGCSWTAVSNNDLWIIRTSGPSGSGNGTVNYTVTVNEGTAVRTGTMTIAGQTFTITQYYLNSDTDRDGLPDDWEIAYFGNLGQGASDDPDGDGLTNLQEYLLGTNPNVPNIYTITASVVGSNGSISPPGTSTVNSGESITFTIMPTTGYHVADVSVDGVPVGIPESYTFNKVTKSYTISATFAVNDTSTIYASADPCGTSYINPFGSQTVNYLASQTFNVVNTGPGTACLVTDVLVDNVSVGPVTTYKFDQVTVNHTIHVAIATGDPATGSLTPTDTDGDGFPDYRDNCPSKKNATQLDTDGDGIGDACDTCPTVANPSQTYPVYYKDLDNDRYSDGIKVTTQCVRPKVCSNSTTGTLCTANANCARGQTCGEQVNGGYAYKLPSDGLISISGDTNDNNPAVYPGAPPSGTYAIVFEMPGYDTWLPTLNLQSTAVAKVMGPPNFTVEIPTTINFEVTKVSRYVGTYTNQDATGVCYNSTTAETTLTTLPGSSCPPTTPTTCPTDQKCVDPIPDFEWSFSGNSINLISKDYGASITIRATATVSGTNVVAYFTLPKDTIGNGVPDYYQQLYLGGLGYKTTDDPDGDGLTIIQELRGVKWGNLVSWSSSAPNVIHGYCSVSGAKCFSDASCPNAGDRCVIYDYKNQAFAQEVNSDGTTKVDHFRLRPDKKDLFVRYYNYDAVNSFAVGGAFSEAGIDVHAIDYATATSSNPGTRNIRVLNVNNELQGTFPDSNTGLLAPYHTDGHIAKRITGVRNWEWATKGSSNVASSTAFYGSGTTTYQKALNYYFGDRAYTDGFSLVSGSWTGNPNTKLDQISNVEDKNDNGANDGEQVISGTWSSDVVVLGSFNLVNGNSPFDINNDGKIELPIQADPLSIDSANQYAKQQVLKHTITHEIFHAIGLYHNQDNTCLMYEYSNNWSRDGHLSNYGKAQIKVYNP